MSENDLISRIDAVLDDDESRDDWSYGWSDSMRWAPEGVLLPEYDGGDESPNSGWEWHPDSQIHAIPAEQVAEWTRWLGTLGDGERDEMQWYVVCFTCGAVGERSVDCGCGLP
ncbi:hypothetical protein [Mycobacteroides abscessus]|uniref:hypothetical protein n=1 Tax=Mycobacteroides abscessus TaxID=36809 RepID=UPI0019D246B5|nr:hypothetical protein [Mycobacteroides abscessus]MBN7559876.1 hypothetical protein [Mycobacteroides abscessus subsp. abscessus]